MVLKLTKVALNKYYINYEGKNDKLRVTYHGNT